MYVGSQKIQFLCVGSGKRHLCMRGLENTIFCKWGSRNRIFMYVEVSIIPFPGIWGLKNAIYGMWRSPNDMSLVSHVHWDNHKNTKELMHDQWIMNIALSTIITVQDCNMQVNVSGYVFVIECFGCYMDKIIIEAFLLGYLLKISLKIL